MARVGGEEFSIILANQSLEQAYEKALKCLHKIRGEVFLHENHELSFTVSMGVAQIQPGETADSLLKRADSALYKSKNTGRNKVTVSNKSNFQPRVA